MIGDELDLDSAMRRVIREAYKDEVPDVIRHQDFVKAWPVVKEQLLAELNAGTYHPRAPEIVETPKSALATRPLAVMSIKDRIIYEALMTRVAPMIDAEIAPEVYSSRIHVSKSGKPYVADPRKAWVQFQKEGRELCDKYENVCMLTTDITSYFEFIDLDILFAELVGVAGLDQPTVDLLKRLLYGLRDGTDLNGIPQGPEVSSFLGNFYLRPLDAILRKLDVRFLRYQDDIKVFASETFVLRKAVLQLTPVVRGRHLNLSSSKTKLLEGDQVKQHFEDARKDAIQYRIAIDDDSVIEDIRGLFDDAVQGEVNERDLRFSLYRLGKFDDDHAVPWVLEHLAEVPYLSGLLVGYLSLHAQNHTEIEPAVASYLNDPKANINPYVEVEFIRMFANLESISPGTYKLLWQILLSPAKDSRSRQFAARAIGRHLQAHDTADLPVLEGLFRQNPDDRPLRRALLVALQEAGDADKAFLGHVANNSPDLAAVCAFLRPKPVLPPP